MTCKVSITQISGSIQWSQVIGLLHIFQNMKMMQGHRRGSIEFKEAVYFNYRYAHMIWRGSRIPYPILANNTSSFEQKFKAIIDCHKDWSLPALTRQLPLWTLWWIWKSRNLLVYQKKSSEWRHDLRKATEEAKEWTICWHTIQSPANSVNLKNSSGYIIYRKNTTKDYI